jgi:hypothetical protein
VSPRERSVCYLRANAGRVCLDDTNDFSQRSPSKVETCEDTAETRVGRCDVGICAVVNVEHQRVGALDQDLGILLLRRRKQGDLVDDIRREPLTESLQYCQLNGSAQFTTYAYLVPRKFLVLVILEQVAEALLVARRHAPELVLEALVIEEVAHAQTVAGHLAAVGWAWSHQSHNRSRLEPVHSPMPLRVVPVRKKNVSTSP